MHFNQFFWLYLRARKGRKRKEEGNDLICINAPIFPLTILLVFLNPTRNFDQSNSSVFCIYTIWKKERQKKKKTNLCDCRNINEHSSYKFTIRQLQPKTIVQMERLKLLEMTSRIHLCTKGLFQTSAWAPALAWASSSILEQCAFLYSVSSIRRSPEPGAWSPRRGSEKAPKASSIINRHRNTSMS